MSDLWVSDVKNKYDADYNKGKSLITVMNNPGMTTWLTHSDFYEWYLTQALKDPSLSLSDDAMFKAAETYYNLNSEASLFFLKSLGASGGTTNSSENVADFWKKFDSMQGQLIHILNWTSNSFSNSTNTTQYLTTESV